MLGVSTKSKSSVMRFFFLLAYWSNDVIISDVLLVGKSLLRRNRGVLVLVVILVPTPLSYLSSSLVNEVFLQFLYFPFSQISKLWRSSCISINNRISLCEYIVDYCSMMYWMIGYLKLRFVLRLEMWSRYFLTCFGMVILLFYLEE